MTRKILTVVFDMDETLGHFNQLYIFFNLVQTFLNRQLNTDELYNMFDLFPEFLRPNIISLLKRIVKKHETNICDYVMLYTNNNGPKYWSQTIIDYFNYKLKYDLFTQIISSFKINNRPLELRNSGNKKSYKHYLNCTRLPKTTQVCFIDDQYYKDMEHDNVVYINIKPYVYNLTFKIMASRYYDSNVKELFKQCSRDKFIKYILLYTKNYNLNYLNKSVVENNIDILITQRMIKEIDNFFIENYHKSN